MEKFAADLQAIDTNGVPLLVREAFEKYIGAVKANAMVRQQGGNTNEANERVSQSKREFIRAVDQYRGQPY